MRSASRTRRVKFNRASVEAATTRPSLTGRLALRRDRAATPGIVRAEQTAVVVVAALAEAA